LTVAVALVLGSSAVFGLAHVPIYGAWKFVSAMVAGVGMGYLFLRHGFLAGILFHFATDYLAAIEIMASASLEAIVVFAVFFLLLIALGLLFFLWYVSHAAELANRLLAAWGLAAPVPAGAASTPRRGFASAFAPATQGPPPPPFPSGPPTPRAPPPSAGVPTYGSGWVTFACPRCGWMEARYDAGRFTCLRCGHASP
ncbi:MAG TPA: CPBP family intramembrane glutamic endopeptidase, partial [Thermoplasmata archaeon]|nr:CPBP family intramembrane glutamic endopeptidase [Thermoplasmata archaeon]